MCHRDASARAVGLWPLAIILAAASGCGEKSVTEDPPPDETPAYVLDACAPDEVPLLGGGCRQVGLPRECWAGWVPSEQGRCEPILPACADGTLAVIGSAECQPIRACGEGRWGSIVRPAGTLHVDSAYTGGSSDGTEARPFRTVGLALAAAPAGATIAIAAGEYVEPLAVLRSVRIEGRCTELVTLTRPVGDRTAGPTVLIQAGTTSIAGVTITGTSWGIGILGVRDVVIEEVWLRDTGYRALAMEGGAAATVRRSLISRAYEAAVSAVDSSLVVEDSAVSDTRENVDGQFGFGVLVSGQPPAEIILHRVLVAGNREYGVVAVGAPATLDEVVIRDTRPDAVEGMQGHGLSIESATATIRRSLFERNRLSSLDIVGAVLDMEDTQVRDTLPAENGFKKSWGFGVHIWDYKFFKAPSHANIRRSLIERSFDSGVVVQGSTADLENVVVRDTFGRAWDHRAGMGLVVHDDPDSMLPAAATVRGARIERNTAAGIMVGGASLLLDSVLVTGSASDARGRHGRGVAVEASRLTGAGADAEIHNSVIEQSRAAGLSVCGARAALDNVVIRSTAAEARDQELGDGIAAGRCEGMGIPTQLQLARTVIEGSARAGLWLEGASASMNGVVLRNNARPPALVGGGSVSPLGPITFGDGEPSEPPADAALRSVEPLAEFDP